MSEGGEYANPAPWPSFENSSVWYAERCLRRIGHLSACATAIQRAWRWSRLRGEEDEEEDGSGSTQIPPGHGLRHRRRHPIVIDRRAIDVFRCSREIVDVRAASGRGGAAAADPEHLSEHAFAYEKLDGTNLGVRDDGTAFGRRRRVGGNGTSYQKINLEEAGVPSRVEVRRFKRALAEAAGLNGAEEENLLPTMILYGELMCNPGRYGYDERAMGGKWFCFGATLYDKGDGDSAESDGGSIGTEEEERLALVERLRRRAGLLAATGKESRKVNVRLNPAFAAIADRCGIPCAPLVDSGRLRDVFLRNREYMTSRRVEGLVLSGENFLKKWKTDVEDESKGAAMLGGMLGGNYPPWLLEIAAVDVELVRCLSEVAGEAKPSREALRAAKAKKLGDKAPSPYDVAVLARAISSAMSKYDALEVYFARGETKMIKEALVAEVADDLNAETKEERKCIDRALGKLVGKRVGAWKMEVEAASRNNQG